MSFSCSAAYRGLVITWNALGGGSFGLWPSTVATSLPKPQNKQTARSKNKRLALIQSTRIRRRFMENVSRLGSNIIAAWRTHLSCFFLFSCQAHSEEQLSDSERNMNKIWMENDTIKTNRKVDLAYSLLKCTAKPILATIELRWGYLTHTSIWTRLPTMQGRGKCRANGMQSRTLVAPIQTPHLARFSDIIPQPSVNS